MQIGDRIITPDGLSGTIVAVIDDGKFSPQYPAAEWSYLGAGVLVVTQEAGLIHLPDVSVVRQDLK
jgi:hypothetical protein